MQMKRVLTHRRRVPLPVSEGDSNGGDISGSRDRLESVEESAGDPPAFVPEISGQPGDQVQY